MFGLGANGAPSDVKERYMELGKEIARTCRESYKNSGNIYFLLLRGRLHERGSELRPQ